MEQDQNQMPALCRANCGFYGSSGQEGMCSKCYKDHLKNKASPPGSSGRISPNAAPSTCSGIPQPNVPIATALPTVPSIPSPESSPSSVSR